MASKPKSIREIVTNLLFNTLPRIDGEPDFAYLSDMTRSLYVNAASLPTTIRGGAHRHVGMIMKDTLYTNIAATVWDQSGTLAALVFPNNTMGGHCEQLK